MPSGLADQLQEQLRDARRELSEQWARHERQKQQLQAMAEQVAEIERLIKLLRGPQKPRLVLLQAPPSS